LLTAGAVRISVLLNMTAEIAIINIDEALDSVPAIGKHLPDQTLIERYSSRCRRKGRK